MTRLFTPLSIVLLALTIAACDSAGTSDMAISETSADDELVLGKQEKVLVCHVGNELPEYDPACTEDCGDAGKIDLIEVAVPTNHLENPSHTYDGVSDYLPGDGVDDGCEIPEPTCPCFTTDDLVEGGPIAQCGENFPGFPDLAGIIFTDGGIGCSGILCATGDPSVRSCAIATQADFSVTLNLTAEEDAGCRALILNHCPNPNEPAVAAPESTSPFIGQ
jgi:hypothetical protein